MVGSVLCRVMLSVFPETQYEYCVTYWVSWSVVVSTLPELVYVPLADGYKPNDPSPPVCWTVPEHEHSPCAVPMQLASAKPRFTTTRAA
jgi:hypothetical protein